MSIVCVFKFTCERWNKSCCKWFFTKKIRGIIESVNSSQVRHELYFECCKMLNMRRKKYKLRHAYNVEFYV